MKILHVTLDLPWPAMRGAQIRDYALITRAAREHEVHVVAYAESLPRPGDLDRVAGIAAEAVVLLRPPGSAAWRSVRGVLRGLPLATTNYVHAPVMAEIRSRLARGGYDLLQIEHSFLAPYVEAAEGTGVATVLSMHNVGALQYLRMARSERGLRGRAVGWAKAALMQGWEAKWADRFDHVVCVSQDDADALATRAPVTVVPNGIDLPARVGPRPGGSDLLFVGNLRYPPNRDAARVLVGEVLPALRARGIAATATVAGFDPPPDLLAGLETRGVEVVPNAPDLAPYYRRAAALVAPLRAGGGTRIKILEALAMGCPVVSTAMGAEGIDVVDGETILLAETPGTCAARIATLLEDDALWDRLSRNGRALVADRYTWDRVWPRLARVYEDVTVRGSGGAAPRDGPS